MSEFLYEMHAHTSETSRCANVAASEVISEYIKAGYSGIAVTDHLSPATFEEFDETNTSWEEKVSHFLKGFKKAEKAAEGKINILLGMELRFQSKGNNNDYLVYGVTEEFLYAHPEILNLNIRSFSDLAHKNGMMIFQAHPFRNGMTIVNPKNLDGIEIYNGNPRHNSRNHIAEQWAKTFGLMTSSGSDYHEYEDIARGGIYFKREIKTNGELLSELRRGDYKIKKTE